jgi:hypothetical protein
VEEKRKQNGILSLENRNSKIENRNWKSENRFARAEVFLRRLFCGGDRAEILRFAQDDNGFRFTLATLCFVAAIG